MASRELPEDRADVSMRSFITRLIWLCILPPLALAIWLAVDSVNNQRQEFIDEARHIAQSSAVVIDQRVEARISGLNMLAVSTLVDERQSWPDLYREAQEYRRSFETHVIFAEAAEPLQMLFNTRVPFGNPLPVLPRPTGQAAAPLAIATGRPAVGNSFIGPVSGTRLVAIAVPVMREGKPIHVLLTTIDASRFQARLDQLDLPANWSIALIDGAGTTIARRTPPGMDSARDVDPGGRITAGLSHAPWSVVLEIPRQVFRLPMYLTLAKFMAGLLAALLIGVAVGKTAARRLVRGVDFLLNRSAKRGTWRSNIAEIAKVGDQLDAAAAQRVADSQVLLASEKRYTATFEQAAVGIALVAPDGHWLRVNQKLAAMVGYSPEELLDKTFQDITHPQDLDKDLDNVRRMLAGEIETYTIEKRYLRKDGETVWVSLTVALMWTEHGEPDYFISVVEDISARKKAQNDELATKGKLSAALASMTDAVFISDAEGRFLEFNEAFATFHKFSTKDDCSKTFDEYPDFLEVYSIDGELMPVDQWAVPRALRGETATNAEFALRRKDTGETWIGSYSFAPIRNQDGMIVGSVVAGRDITERMAAAAAVRENENRLRLALDAAKAGIWEWDLRTHRNTWSDEAFRLYGLQPGCCEPSNEAWLATVHPDDRDAAADALNCAWDQAIELNVEWRVNSPEGDERWLMSRGRPEFDAKGKAVRYLGIVMDITERKRAEAELGQHRYHLEQLVASRTAEVAAANRKLTIRANEISELYNDAPCGYHSLAEDGTILAVNDTELKLLGYTREEFVGRRIGEFMTPESLEFFHSKYPEFARTGRIRDLEFDFIYKDGTIAPVLVGGDLVRDAQGRFVHTRSILIDNRERKEREQLLEHMRQELAHRVEEANAANHAKSVFLANMSHEIRTPMNAIIGLTHLVQRAVHSPEQSERMKKIESAGQHLLSIINDILDISKIEAGRVELESTDFHLSAILDNIHSLIAESARNKGLRIEIDEQHFLVVIAYQGHG